MTTAMPMRAEHLRTTLTDRQSADLGLLAARLAKTPPCLVDDPGWMDAARRLCCQVPLPLREALRRYRHSPGSWGLLVLHNLPIDESSLPATPTVPESVERLATSPAALAVLIALQLGEIVAYQAEKSGAMVQNVVPVAGQEETQSNAGATRLEMHVENAFHPHRPDYIGLLCLRGDHTKTAAAVVSSIRDAMRLIPEDVRDILRRPNFITKPPPSFTSGESTVHAVVDGRPDDPNVRVDFNATCALNDDGKLALEQLRTAFVAASQTIVLKQGDMAIIDNRVAIHGRTTFVPRFDGKDRWLHRIFIHLDNRRTRAGSLEGGAVLF
jgi:L-asparagine oxygenase